MAFSTLAPSGNPSRRYHWFTPGDINGFFGLIIDNMAVISIMTAILKFGFGIPGDFIVRHMIPGTALGVLFGDLVYTWMAFRLASRTGNPHVTAMPLGLDTPSSIGIALTVLGPAFLAFKAHGLSPDDAALQTWHVGMATMVLIGIIKIIFSFAGSWVQRIVPQAGLLGSLAGIGLALIGFLPLIKIFSVPVVGLIAMGLLFYAVIAGIKLPKNFPGVLFAIIVGTVLYYILAPQNLLGVSFEAPRVAFSFAPPLPTFSWCSRIWSNDGLPNAITYFPIAFPFAILTVIGGINVTESARVAGDDFNTRNILLTEAIATLIAGVTGGVAQSTPYIGQPAYKAMGSRAGYTLLTGLFIGIAGVTGIIGFLVDAIPEAALAPVLIFVALDIMSQAFLACPARHAAAVGFAFLPTVARMLDIKFSGLKVALNDALTATPELKARFGPVPIFDTVKTLSTTPGKTLPELLVITALGNGFILTGMLWGAFLSEMVDRKLKSASLYLLICAVLAFFGIIHSADPDGKMYLPWRLTGVMREIPIQFTAAYAILALIMFILSFTREANKPPVDQSHALVH